MATDKARTQRIQRVYGLRDYDELTSEYDGWASEYTADRLPIHSHRPRLAHTLRRMTA